MQDATWITELDDATQFVIWSYRRWVSGPDHWTLVRREYDGRFGAEAGRATLADFARLIEALCAGAHRRLEYHTACCPCVCHDELRLAALVGAAQPKRRDLNRQHVQAIPQVFAERTLLDHSR